MRDPEHSAETVEHDIGHGSQSETGHERRADQQARAKLHPDVPIAAPESDIDPGAVFEGETSRYMIGIV